jgi:hypothetical protein
VIWLKATLPFTQEFLAEMLDKTWPGRAYTATSRDDQVRAKAHNVEERRESAGECYVSI